MPAPKPDDDRPVYSIAVAAELAGTTASTLRFYENRGLIQPVRTPGGTRRYSTNDLARLHRIAELANAGVNLAGIRIILTLQDDDADCRNRVPRKEPSH